MERLLKIGNTQDFRKMVSDVDLKRIEDITAIMEDVVNLDETVEMVSKKNGIPNTALYLKLSEFYMEKAKERGAHQMIISYMFNNSLR